MKITIINWDSFQHYKNRRPPWIKFYRDLLDNDEYRALSDFAVRLLNDLWLLASEAKTPGELDVDSTRLAWRLRYTKKQTVIDDTLKELRLQGFISLDSEMLAGGLQHATPEREIEKRKREKAWYESFEVFWLQYPRKDGSKKVAKTAWMKHARNRVEFDTIITALQNHRTCEQWTKDGGKFIPHAATWLNQERWTDEMDNANAGTHGSAPEGLG